MENHRDVEIARTVRFCIDSSPTSETASDRHNTFAGWPSMSGLGSFQELEVRCRGQADPLTGYLLNISAIDKVVRDLALPIIASAIRQRPQVHPGAVVAEIVPALRSQLGALLTAVRWKLTPYYCVTMRAKATDRVLMSQQFEFSAAHRLHSPTLDDQTNRKVFGKCNNRNGHGHNYRLEVAVVMPLERIDRVAAMRLPALEQIVDHTIIQRFDHTHLNLDTVEFANLNPSVEHIARVCHDLLVEPIRACGAEVHHVTVWETTKTSCTYPAPE